MICQKRVLVIVTGGTVCMELEGEVLRTASMSKVLGELNIHPNVDFPQVEILEWPVLIDSSDMRCSEWAKLAEQIRENYDDYNGFVILHGTDTMSYTASALSFMLQGLTKPVIITGSMLPIHNIQTDAKRNVILSISTASLAEIKEVCILFGSKLMRGNRTRKLNCDLLEAFDSPNHPPLGSVGVNIFVDYESLLKPSSTQLKLFTDLCPNVMVLTITPNFSTLLLESVFASTIRPLGVILCIFGTGTAPCGLKGFMKVLAQGKLMGIALVAISQCSHGSCSLSTYENGLKLQQLGIIEGKDMTPEAAFVKLSFLLGKGLAGDDLKTQMETHIAGELTTHHPVITGQSSCKESSPRIGVSVVEVVHKMHE